MYTLRCATIWRDFIEVVCVIAHMRYPCTNAIRLSEGMDAQ